MEDKEILEKVKKAIGVGGTYHDETIMIYIDEIKEYLRCAGVPEDVVNGSKSVGVITRGVMDLWNYGNGNTSLSTYFMQRVTQLVLSNPKEV